MKRYSIPCTEAQTRKALELGAPIQYAKSLIELVNVKHFVEGAKLIIIPTAEEMIGFLEDEFSLQFLTGVDIEDMFFFNVYHNEGHIEVKGYHSRKEATLAAIDATLEYLEPHKL